MQLKRFKDIVAIEGLKGHPPLAFHARNLEVAALSPEAYAAMEETSLQSSLASETLEANEATEALLAWELEHNPEVKSGQVSYGIRSLTINVTQVCNLHCKYCAAGGDGSFGDAVKKIAVEETLPQLKFFLQKLKPHQNFHITFLGGEPLLYPEAIQLIADYVRLSLTGKENTFTFSVVTNGTLFNEKTIALLNNIQAQVTVSIDGPAEINDITRPSKGQQGSTEKIIAGLNLLFSNKNQISSVGLSGVFGRNNLDFLKAYDFYRGFAADWFEFNYDYSETDPAINEAYMQGMQQVMAKAYALGGEEELRRIRQVDHYFEMLDNQQRVENFCGAGKSFLMMDARNQLYTCPWVVNQKDEVVGKPGDNLEDLEQKLAQYQAPLIQQNRCQSCWARFLCGGGCMFINKLKNDDKNKKDQQFCVRTRFLISQALVYYHQCRAQ